ncbi:MAG: hypothetical protein GX240_06420 [Candidatus Atribacteria bacterium]|nr:hypothetical protein [Candidatus Atribacteria bacterium]
MKDKFTINFKVIDEINEFFTEKNNPVIDEIIKIVDKYGGPQKINSLSQQNGTVEVLIEKLHNKKPEYFDQLNWLIEQRESKKFINMEKYKSRINTPKDMLDESYEVTLEISSLHYFPWLISQAKQAIERGELLPSRFIRVRYMKEQEDDGDLLATISAMKILGSSWVESLDTKGTDGSNIHLGGPETITGYFGGIGQPNDYVYKWIDEYLYYYTNYGIKEVLNINGGTILAGYFLYKLGIDIAFKISVFMGNDNPLNVLWTFLTARLFSREDGSTPLAGFNLSNSVNNQTISFTGDMRKLLGLEDLVRIEHHIVETSKGIVKQPYDRLTELIEIAKTVKNISAKHEGGIPEVERSREHPSDLLDYFISKNEVIEKKLMPYLERNYLDKHDAVQRTAQELLRNGIPVKAAPNLHYY